MINAKLKKTELVTQYKKFYYIADDADVTEDMILSHWELEKQLRITLLESTPERRWEAFDDAYSKLYHELAWLNEHTSSGDDHGAQASLWHDVIGDAPQKIYEVGSGKGELITYLAKQGFDCTATEITRERGEKWSADVQNLRWDNSDGIHLSEFTSPNTYDVVLSNQVIEHMHPEDVATHFDHVNKLLKKGGRYIFSTPHLVDGPSDVSRVFGCGELKGMHLKEYNYAELASFSTQANLTPKAVWRLPNAVRSRLETKTITSSMYLSYLKWCERFLLATRKHRRRVQFAKLSRFFFFTGNVMMVATKD